MPLRVFAKISSLYLTAERSEVFIVDLKQRRKEELNWDFARTSNVNFFFFLCFATCSFLDSIELTTLFFTTHEFYRFLYQG